MFPYHLCCRVQIPEASKKYPLAGMDISLTNKSYDSVTLLVNDEVSHSTFQQHNSKVQGDNLQSPEGGVNTFKLKIRREIRIESDPNSNCLDYREAGEYDKCLEAEMIKQMKYFVNCTPPWMTENENLWCTQKHAQGLRDIDVRHYLGFMNDMISGQVDYGKCSPPCTKYSFYSTGLGFVENLNYSGVTIFFDKIIDDTIFEYKIDSFTLLTRFGGIIGLTRNLLWVVLLFLSIAGYFYSSKSGKVKEESTSRREVVLVHEDNIGVHSSRPKGIFHQSLN